MDGAERAAGRPGDGNEPALPGAPGASHALGERERSLVELAAALASRDEARLEAMLDRAAAAADPKAVEEALLQSYLFLGYPAAIDALGRWRRRAGAPGPAAEEPDWEGWLKRGEQVCERVYGGQYGRLRSNVAALHPEMELWMLAEGYGKVLGRSGLDLATRELCIVAMLAVLGAGPQLYSHLRGALNVGVPAAAVAAALEAALAFASPDRAALAREVWARVRDRRG